VGRLHSVLRERTVAFTPAAPQVVRERGTASVGLGMIGSGNYATGVLIPAMKAVKARLVSVASNTGVSGVHAGRKFGFDRTTTDVDSLLSDPAVDAVVITTRHDTHADFTVRALDAGKHVFVEKPLALTLDQIAAIEAAMERARNAGRPRHLMVGFNRRFAPHVVLVKTLLAAPGPRAMVMTVNAGAIPSDHWTQDRETGGGRIIGEACHFVDLLRHVAGAPIVRHQAIVMASPEGDTATLSLAFGDGSIGTIHYFANGHKAVPKERLEVFHQGRVLRLDNFRRLTGHGLTGFTSTSLWRQDKGQTACAAAFVAAIQEGRPPPIPLDELFEVARATIALAGAAQGGAS
jgi:predicted dehydrogenase